MTATLFHGTRYVLTASFASCLTAVVFAFDHHDTISWVLFGLTLTAGVYRCVLLPFYRAREQRRPIGLAESGLWSTAFGTGAIFLAACVALSIWKAYGTAGAAGASEQTVLFALSLGLTTGTAMRWSVPPWTGLGTALILMPVLAYCNMRVGDEHHLLMFLLVSLYFLITIASIKNSYQAFVQSVIAAEEIERLATYDKLTGVLNRLGFSRTFDRMLADAAARKTRVSMLHIDLDRFKQVNDMHGHAAGDALLCAVSRCLERCCSGGERIARLGGDEFVIIFEGSEAEAEQLAASIVVLLHQPFSLLGKVLEIGSSIGVNTFSEGTMDEMLSCTDFALYRAKANGRNCHVVFKPEMRREIDDKRALETALCRALQESQISVHYQPLVEMTTREIVAVEALARWHLPGFGEVSPDVFIRIAEEIGVIGAIGEWVLETACREVLTWSMPVTVAVNVSPGQFLRGDFPDTVLRILAMTGLPASRLELEVTEGVLIDQNSSAKTDIELLRSMGIRMSLDDFGAGSSSISYLRRFRFDKIKIDRSFISACASDVEAEDMVRGIVSLAHGLNLPVVAEGVETVEQASKLDRLKCSQMQGYLFGRPMPGQEARALVQSRKATPRLSLLENVARHQ